MQKTGENEDQGNGRLRGKEEKGKVIMIRSEEEEAE
jgi:hypothetical protein